MILLWCSPGLSSSKMIVVVRYGLVWHMCQWLCGKLHCKQTCVASFMPLPTKSATCHMYAHIHSHAGDPSSSLTSRQLFGIVFGPLVFVFLIITVFLSLGVQYWKDRHYYRWYNTLTTPSSWCNCDCFSSCPAPSSWYDCCCNRRTRQPPPRRLPVTREPTGNLENIITFVSAHKLYLDS